MEKVNDNHNNGDFAEWLQDEMDKRGWSQAELVRRSRVNSGLLSQVLSRKRRPGSKFCLGVAKAFKIDDSIVMLKAGLISEKPNNNDEVITRIDAILRGWSHEERVWLFDLALTRDELLDRRRRRKGGHGKPATPPPDEPKPKPAGTQ